MTITTTTLRAQYNGNGVTTSFAVPFEFLEGSTLKVILTDGDGVDTTQTITTHYTVTGGGTVQPDDGSVVMVTAPATGETLTILRAQPLTQAASYTEQGPFPAKAHEKALDRLDMQVQMVAERVNRAVKLKETSTNADLIFPEPSADEVVGWNAAGTALENKALSDLGNLVEDSDDITQGVTNLFMTAAERAKVGHITVTQAVDLDAMETTLAGAVLEGDTSTAAMQFVVDEDNMASNSATKVPTQQSVKAYVDANGLNPYHFGAVGDGVTDDAVAIAAWVAASNGWLILPPGRFKTSAAITIDLDTVDAVTIQGAGESLSELIYTGTGDFITLDRDGLVGALADLIGVTIDGLTFRTTQVGLANAVRIELDDAAPSTGSYEGMHRRVSNVRFMGEGAGACWAEGVRWNNATFSTTENVMFRGIGNVGNAVIFGGTRSAVDNFVSNIKAIACDTIILVENDTLEGLYTSNLVGVSVLHAVDWQTATPAPALVVEGGHINVVDGGTAFLLDGVNAPTLSNLSIYLNGTSTAISLDNDIAQAMLPAFANVNVFGITSATGKTGLLIGAGVNRAMVGGVTFNGIETGVTLTSGCTNITLLPTLGFFGVTTPISDGTNGAAANGIRKWSNIANTQRLVISDDAGVHFELENTSRANNTTKFLQSAYTGRDTIGTEKQVGYSRFAPNDGNWVASLWQVATRVGDVVTQILASASNGDLTAAFGLRSAHATRGIGYAAGAGGAVTQATSKSTGVTLNRACGQITMHNASLAGGAVVSFTLTNSAIAATDILNLGIAGGQATGASYFVGAVCAAGSAVISVRNLTAGALGEALVLGFTLEKVVAA